MKEETNLLHLVYSMIQVSFPVECWSQPTVPDTGIGHVRLHRRALPVTDAGQRTMVVLRADAMARRGGRRDPLARASSSSRATGSWPVDPQADVPRCARVVDLGDATLLPGLMDMELNFLIGGPETPTGLPSAHCTVCRTTPPTARCGPR